ncbi:hypothetical protein GH733_008184 [Mirounga leonina]|nr:hypothetical protein GH733_008184 [Mirounga leonina]
MLGLFITEQAHDTQLAGAATPSSVLSLPGGGGRTQGSQHGPDDIPRGTVWNTSYWFVCSVMTLISSGRDRPVESPGVALSSPPPSLCPHSWCFCKAQQGEPQAWISRHHGQGYPDGHTHRLFHHHTLMPHVRQREPGWGMAMAARTYCTPPHTHLHLFSLEVREPLCQASGCAASVAERGAQSTAPTPERGALEEEGAGRGESALGPFQGPPWARGPPDGGASEEAGDRPAGSPGVPVVSERPGGQNGLESSGSRSGATPHARSAAGGRGPREGRPYQCGTCDRSFRCSSDVAKHRGIHSGAKPYACGDGEKPFRCTECGRTFRLSSHLIQHQRLHGTD